MTRLREIALLRLVAQRIAGPGLPTATDTVRGLTALQAQDFPGALVSVALRTQDGARAGVERALNAADVVRSWPFRGTLHLVAAEDLGWMLELAGARGMAGAASRRAQLGLGAADLVRAQELAEAALAGGGRLRRDALLGVWDASGLSTDGQRGAHLLVFLAQSGVLCLGPVEDGRQLFVLADEWIARPRRLGREEALGELALRYFRSHGPATRQDFGRWTGLLAAEVRAACALARPELDHVVVDGVEYAMDPSTPERLASSRRQALAVHLLPGFDELLLGYQDRRSLLAPEFAERIVPGGNGIFRPTVVAGGRVVGTWKHVGRGAGRSVDAAPFTAFSDAVAAAVTKRHRALP